MARMPRIIVPGQALHIIQRGNNRQATFFSDEDYLKYLDNFGQLFEQGPLGSGLLRRREE